MITEFWLQTDYAKSGRSMCRGCLVKIDKDALRIAVVQDVDQSYHSEKWYHPDCLQTLPKQIREKKDKNIVGYEDLKAVDKTKINQKLHQLVENPTSKSNQKKQKSTKKNTKKVESDQESDQGQKKAKSHKLQKAKVESSDESEGEQDPKKPNGYSEQEWKEIQKVSKEYENQTAAAIKMMLKLNEQPQTGNKDELLGRIAECKVLGSIPKCNRCGGGRPRYNNINGKYQCPGYMEDTEFKHCRKVFTKEEISRIPWKEL